MAASEELTNGTAAEITVIERVVVDVHADELVRERFVHSPGERHGVSDAGGAVFESVANAFPEDDVDCGTISGGDVFANDISDERERETGFGFPPCTEVENKLEAVTRVGELAFVDDQADVGVTVGDELEDFIERNDGVDWL